MKTRSKNSEKRINLYMDNHTKSVAKILSDERGLSISELVKELIHEEKARPDDPLAELAIHKQNILRALKNAGVAYRIPEREKTPVVDMLLPSFSMGIELKSKFNPGSAVQKMIEVIGYSAGKFCLRRVLIVLPDSISDAEKSRFDSIVSNAIVCDVAVCRLREMIAIVKGHFPGRAYAEAPESHLKVAEE